MAGAVATAEAKKKPKPKPKPVPVRVERTVEGGYGSYPAPVTGCNSPLGPFSCLTIQTHSFERYFTAKATDAHGLPVFVEVDSPSGTIARFCGETKEPIRFSPNTRLRFHVAVPDWGVQMDCPQHSVKTTGTISVTISNLP